jgi:hypothetical protein
MVSRFHGLLKVVVLACTVSGLALEGCSTRSGLVRSGFHTTGAAVEAPQTLQVVIWSNHPEVEQPLLQWLDQLQGPAGNNVLVRRAFMEQRSTLPSVPHDLEILQLARQVGADEVIIAEILIKPARAVTWYPHRRDGEAGDLVYVAARAFAVDTQAMRWSGTAECTQAVMDADKLALPLARIAVALGMGRSADEPLLQQDLRICSG